MSTAPARPIPAGYKEIPVPAGILIGSIEGKLDAFLGVCIGVVCACTDSALEQARQAWDEFTDEERTLFDAPGLSEQFAELQLLKARDSNPAQQAAVRELGQAVRTSIDSVLPQISLIRGNLMSGRVRRPRHVNPPTMLVRA